MKCDKNDGVVFAQNANTALVLWIEPFAKVRCGMNPMMRKFMGG